MDIERVQRVLRAFALEREWEQFHHPKNLAMALAGEAGELVEIYQWLTELESRSAPNDSQIANATRAELADILIYAISNDHIHFAIRIPNRVYYKKFIRALTGIIARKMGKGMWRLMPLTKLVLNRFHHKALIAYIKRNEDEARLEVGYKARRYSKKDRARLGPPATFSPNLIRDFPGTVCW